jgi:hypothetical protein
MARRYAELDRESLDLSGRQVGLQERQVGLQQQQLNIQQNQARWQREMLRTNAIIQGTQAALSMTRAAVGLGQAIGQYHDQQANLAIQTAATQYQAGVTEAITNGFNPYKIDTLENGQEVRRYIGYDNYKLADGTTLGQLKEQAVSLVGGKYWTKSGAEQGAQIAANAFEDIELAAQRQTADAVIKNRQKVFDQELTNAIVVSQTTGDSTQVHQVINGAPWLTEDEKRATALEAERAARYGNIKNTALSIADTQGISKAKEFLDGNTALSKDQNSEILAEAQRVSNQGEEAARTEAADAYTKTQGTIRQKYNAAIGQNITNPDEREARRQTAQRKQIYDLSERFSRETNGATLDRLEALKARYKEGGTYNADYYELEQLQKDHYSEISRRIEEMKTDTARTESSAGNTLRNDINDSLDLMMSEWRAPDSGYDGRKVLEFMIANERNISPEKKERYEKELLGNPASSGEYTRLDSLLKAQRPGENAGALEKADFARKEYEIKASIIDARLKGATTQQLREMINGIIEVESTDIVMKAFNKGQLNTGWGASAARTETELLYLMNQGKLDAYFGERTLSSLGTEAFTVGDDEKVNTVMAQINDRGKVFLNDELKAEGVTVGGGEMVKDTGGDKDGSLRYLGSDGNYYRVGVKGPIGPRFMEKWNNTDKKWEPYTPKRVNADTKSGYRPSAFPGDM